MIHEYHNICSVSFQSGVYYRNCIIVKLQVRSQVQVNTNSNINVKLLKVGTWNDTINKQTFESWDCNDNIFHISILWISPLCNCKIVIGFIISGHFLQFKSYTWNLWSMKANVTFVISFLKSILVIIVFSKNHYTYTLLGIDVVHLVF